MSNEEQSNIKHFQIYIDQRTEKYKTKGTSNSLAYPMFGYVLLSKVLSCYLATQTVFTLMRQLQDKIQSEKSENQNLLFATRACDSKVRLLAGNKTCSGLMPITIFLSNLLPTI